MSAQSIPEPNSGSAVTDTVAAGDDNILQSDWIEERNIDKESRIQLTKLSHVRYEHPNLEEIHVFLLGKKQTVLYLYLNTKTHKISA